MLFTKISPQSIIQNRLQIDCDSIFVNVPDSKMKIDKAIYGSQFLLSNCLGVISPNKNIEIQSRIFNGKEQYIDTKKIFQSTDDGKKLKVISSLPQHKQPTKNILGKTKTNNFYFYDCSILSQAFDFLSKKMNTHIMFDIIINEFESLYEKLKFRYPEKQINFILSIENEKGFLYEFLKLAVSQINKEDYRTLKFFDLFVLGNVPNKLLIPLCYYKKNKLELVKQNLNKLFKQLKINKLANDIKKSKIVSNKETVPIKDKAEDSKLKLNGITKIKGQILEDNNQIKIKIDNNQLRKILRNNKITDPDILANVHACLEDYIQDNPEEISKDKILNLILKAIHQTLFNTDVVGKEYLANPKILLEKTKEIDTYRTPLKFPKLKYVINPTDIIDIDYTTGQFRQKFEFTKTIHNNVKKLFKSLENVSTHPIKIVSIKHTVKDDDLNRFIEYSVKLKNQDQDEPYVVKFKVPGIVNDKYFKINGNNYIISNQQCLKPITKTANKNVRFLSNYAIIELEIVNLKFTPNEINSIIDYIKTRYKSLIKNHEDNIITFKDDSKMFLTNPSTLYKDKNKEIIYEDNLIKNKKTGDIIPSQRKYEFFFEVFQEKISSINPDDNLIKNINSIPYFRVYMSGIRLPLIFYLWSQKGLISTLSDMGIDFEITDKEKGYISVPFKDKFLSINPKSLREKLVVNGLMTQNISKPFENLTDKENIHSFINNAYGSRSIYQINLITENQIDPVTKELLEFENLPTNLPALLSDVCVDKLLNHQQDSLSDLKIYRSRMSEMVLNVMYSQIMQAHNFYRSKVEFGDKQAKLIFDPDYIMKNLISEGVLQYTSAINPLSEIILSSQVIKSGPGGVRSSFAYKKEHRNIHKSHEGIFGANSTHESGKIGLTLRHTLTPTIVNSYGSYGQKSIQNLSGWKSASIDELLTPFINQINPDRCILAVTHASQVTPVNNLQKPIVRTGAEQIIPQLASKRFVHKAKKDGIIQNIENNKTLQILYDDNTSEVLDISPRKSQAKLGNFIELSMENLPEGTKVKANQIISKTKYFDFDGTYMSGVNLNVAVMNYMGYSHEDSYCISKELSLKTTTSTIKKLTIIVPTNTDVNFIENKINKKIKDNDILVEYQNKLNISSFPEEKFDYLDAFTSSNFIDYTLNDQNKTTLFGINGEIVSIKVYINNRKNLDKKVVNLHNNLVKEARDTIKKLTIKQTKDKKIVAVDNLNLKFIKIGRHKFKNYEFDGALIEYMIKQEKKLREGDKLSNRFGAKGVISKIIEEPVKGSFTDKIDIFISPISIFGRKSFAMIKELYLGKIFVNLNKQIKEMSKNPKTSEDKIIKLITDIFDLATTENAQKAIRKSIEKTKSIKKEIKSGNFELFCLIEPFKNVSFNNIESAAKLLNIPLDEKVYIPELKTWTIKPVPVGVSYFTILEHYSNVFANVRGSEKYQKATGQPTRGKSKLGGQSIGNLDIYALLQSDANSIIEEFRHLRSDNHKMKWKTFNNIIETGKANLPKNTDFYEGKTKDIFDTYLTSMGLNIQ